MLLAIIVICSVTTNTCFEKRRAIENTIPMACLLSANQEAGTYIRGNKDLYVKRISCRRHKPMDMLKKRFEDAR